MNSSRNNFRLNLPSGAIHPRAALDPLLVVFPELSDWKTGDWQGIKRWRAIHSKPLWFAGLNNVTTHHETRLLGRVLFALLPMWGEV
jgi:hypothetical protein